MYIATCAVSCVKLRRNGMNGADYHDQADPDHAAPTELDSALGGVAAINMALLTELGACASTDACKVRGECPAFQTFRPVGISLPLCVKVFTLGHTPKGSHER